MTNRRVILLAPAMSLCISQSLAQEAPVTEMARPKPLVWQEWASPDKLRYRNLALISGEALLVGWYGKANWWQDGFTGNFSTVNEGWFGQRTQAGGADKLGHFYMTYAMSRLTARAFTWVGNDPGDAVKLAAITTFGTMMAVEIIDGYSKRWRFSREDAVMNALGAATAVLLEKNPALDRLLDLRLHYRPSAANGRDFDPFGDYSGQTYVLALKASGVPALRDHPWLRYLEFAVGYGARNFPENRFDAGGGRKRNVYAGISLNLSELLGKTAFKNTPGGRGQAFANTVFEYVQVPGTAVYARHSLDKD